MDKLLLSDEQRQQMQELTSSLHTPFQKNKVEFNELHSQQKAMIMSETFDETAFRELYRKTASIKEDIAVEHARIKREIRALLTDEQRKKMDQMFNSMKRGSGMGGGPGGPGGGFGMPMGKGKGGCGHGGGMGMGRGKTH